MLSKVLSRASLIKKAFRPSAYPFSTTFANKFEEHNYLSTNENTMEDFWREEIKDLDWYKQPTTILDKSNAPFYRWFKDGLMNTSYNCLDRHVEQGLGNQPALIYESPVTNTSASYTFGEALDMVSRFANVLQKHGVTKGDRVVIYMPMIPEAQIAVHACARIGAIHSVVFGGFAGPELGSRIKAAQPKVVVTASCGIEPNRIVDYKPMLDEAVQIAGLPDLKRIVVQRNVHKHELRKGIEYEFYDELSKAKLTAHVPVYATDPLYILYTSGTTGVPKGVVRDHGGNAASMAYCFKYVYDIGKGDTYFSTADIGWVTGHSFLSYGPWLRGAATIIYEGKPVGTPDAGILWRIIEKHRANGLFTSPTALRAIRKEDPDAKMIKSADLSTLRTLFVGGERLDISAYNWILESLPKTCLVSDSYGQTELGWYISTNYKNLHTFPNKPGCAGKATPGVNIQILDDEGNSLPPLKIGAVCMKHPTPPSFASTIYNNDEEFLKKYMGQYKGYYFTGDAGYVDADGDLHVVSRLDDVINTGAHRLSTAQMEEVLTNHKDIVEAAVIGAKDDIKGEIPVGFIVLKTGVVRSPEELEKECIQKVRQDIGPVASFKYCMVVEKLPKTRSGKIVRKVLRNIADGAKLEIPPTIEDITVIDRIKKLVEERGLGKQVDLKFKEI